MVRIRRTRNIIVMTALFFAVAVVTMRSLFLWMEYRSALERAEAATRDMAQVLEEYAKRTFETGHLIGDLMLAYVREQGGVEALRDSEAAYRYLSELTRETTLGGYLMIVDDRGIPVVLSDIFPIKPVDLSDRRWFRAHAEGGEERHIGEAIHSRITDEILFTYSRGIVDPQGRFEGAIQIAVRTTVIQTLSLTSEFAQHLVLGLFGEDGRIIARTNLPPEMIGRRLTGAPPIAEFLGQRTGTYRAPSQVDGIERIISFRRLQDWAVIVTASLPVTAALAPWYKSLYWSIGVLALVLLGLGGLTWLGIGISRREEQAVIRLRQSNQDLAQALNDKEVLLKEIHHRVKNNLQVTASLLQMQAQRFDDPDVQAAFQETQDRLRSIGLVHETLYSKDTGASVNLPDYIGRLAEGLSTTYAADRRGIVVDLDLEPMTISLDRAVPLALSLTEAISNAFKHGFGPQDQGRITISARRANGDLEVMVRDTGKGLSKAPVRDDSLGLKLIRALAMQLGGRFSLETDHGTVFRLVIPAAD